MGRKNKRIRESNDSKTTRRIRYKRKKESRKGYISHHKKNIEFYEGDGYE